MGGATVIGAGGATGADTFAGTCGIATAVLMRGRGGLEGVCVDDGGLAVDSWLKNLTLFLTCATAAASITERRGFLGLCRVGCCSALVSSITLHVHPDIHV
jgi:hypothetical protein